MVNNAHLLGASETLIEARTCDGRSPLQNLAWGGHVAEAAWGQRALFGRVGNYDAEASSMSILLEGL